MIVNWRSLLFVPADNLVRQAKAQGINADAIILDLEDGVSPASKPDARKGLSNAAKKLQDSGLPVVVRVNKGWRDLMADLAVGIDPSVQAIMVPKVENAAQVIIISQMMAEFELSQNITVGSTGLIALIESPLGLTNLFEISVIDRVIGFALGTEDFCLELGVAPSLDVLSLPARQIAFAAAKRKQMALAIPRSIAEFRDMDAYGTAVNLAANFGATGAICIHPAQVIVANNGFRPDAIALVDAQKIIDVWEAAQAQGQAIASHDGMMIDLPVVQRAKALLQKAN